MFGAGGLTPEGAVLLNEMARQYLRYGFRVRVTNWPLSVAEVGRLGGQIIGFDPKALAEDDAETGSGDQITVIIDICLDGTGGGYVRKRLLDRDNLEVLDEWCEPIPVCGSGADGGLCDDILPPSGSGSGSGSGGGGGTLDPVACDGCDRTLSDTLIATLDGGHGTIPLGWTGTYWQGFKTLGCGEDLHLRYNPATCTFQYSCNGTDWQNPSIVGPSITCGPPTFTQTFVTATCNMDNLGAGCVFGSCGSVGVLSISE